MQEVWTVLELSSCVRFVSTFLKQDSEASVAHLLMFCNVMNQSQLIHWTSSMKTRIGFTALIHCQDPSTGIMG